MGDRQVSSITGEVGSLRRALASVPDHRARCRQALPDNQPAADCGGRTAVRAAWLGYCAPRAM